MKLAPPIVSNHLLNELWTPLEMYGSESTRSKETLRPAQTDHES